MKTTAKETLLLLFNRFDVQVIVYHLYSNFLMPRVYKGVLKRTKKNETEQLNLFFKRGQFKYEKLENVFSEWIVFSGRKRVIQLLEVSTGVFYPLVWVNNRLLYYVRTPLVNEKGEPVLDENGKQKYELQERVLVTASEVNTPEGVKEIPTLIAQDIQLTKSFFYNELARASQKYLGRDFMGKYGTLIIVFVIFVGVALIMYINYEGFIKAADRLAQANAATADAIKNMMEVLNETV